jgi:hypothetical protein
MTPQTSHWKEQARQHWKEFLPNRYYALKQRRKLERSLDEAVLHTKEGMLNLEKALIQQGHNPLSANETAWELMRGEYLFPPAETTESPTQMTSVPEPQSKHFSTTSTQ